MSPILSPVLPYHHIVLYARRLEDRVAELEQRVTALEREKGRGDEA